MIALVLAMLVFIALNGHACFVIGLLVGFALVALGGVV